jgi:probable HAF family extracellular repeat protein
MKTKILRNVFLSLGAIFALAATLPVQLASNPAAAQHRYRLIDVGTFGGPNSGYFGFISARSLNNRGEATGTADTPTAVSPPFCFNDCFLAHAFLSRDGGLTDLGGLPGVSISGSGPNDINARGVVSGIAFNGLVDDVIGLPFFDAVVWKNGQIIDLGTFGGNLSYANEINNNDQVAGFALNTTPDSFDLGDFCQNFPMPTQMRAFIWQNGVKQDLGTLGGTDSCALFMNERGQAAGNSFTDSIVNPTTGLPTIHPFLWTNGRMVDLGTLGGTLAVANAINDRGQVAGDSNLAGDMITHPFVWDRGVLTDLGTLGGDNGTTHWINNAGDVVGFADLPGSTTHHGFLWRKGIMQDLGTVANQPCSNAIRINSKGQIVGRASDCMGGALRAFLWDKGSIVDLNDFVPTGSGLTLTEADYINDRGEIAAQGVIANGDLHGVFLIPCGDGEEGCHEAAKGGAIASQTAPASVNRSSSASIHVRRTPGQMVSAWRTRVAQRYHIPSRGAPKD